MIEPEKLSSAFCSARDLISKLLTTDAVKRLTAAQALEHPWIKNASKAHKGTLTLTRRNLAKHVGARVKVHALFGLHVKAGKQTHASAFDHQLGQRLQLSYDLLKKNPH